MERSEGHFFRHSLHIELVRSKQEDDMNSGALEESDPNDVDEDGDVKSELCMFDECGRTPFYWK